MADGIIRKLTVLLLIWPDTVLGNYTDPSLDTDRFANNKSCGSYSIQNADNDSVEIRYCEYPNLFSIENGTCSPFSTVDCGNRQVPITPCDYPNKNCSRPKGENTSLCTCEKYPDLNYDMCLTLDNGSHVWPARRWSPFYIQCTSQRTIPTECHGPSVMYNFFQDTCQFVYEVVNAAYSLSLSLDIPESLYHLISPMPTKFLHQPTQAITTTRPPAATTDTQLKNFISKTDIKTSRSASVLFPLSHSLFGGEFFGSREVLSHTTLPSGELSLFTAARTESYSAFYSTDLLTMGFSSIGEIVYSIEESLMLLPSSVLVEASHESSPSTSLFTNLRGSFSSSMLVMASSRSQVSAALDTIIKTPAMKTSQINSSVTEEIKLFGYVTYLSESITGDLSYLSDMTTLMPTPSLAKCEIMSTLDRNANLQSRPSADPSEAALPSKSTRPFTSLMTQFKESELYASYDFMGSFYSTPTETSTPIAESGPAESVHTVETLKTLSTLCVHADCTVSTIPVGASDVIFSLESFINTLKLSSSPLISYISLPSPSPSFSSISSLTLTPFSTYSVLLNNSPIKSLSPHISPSPTKRLPLNLPSSSSMPDKASDVSLLQSDVYISNTKKDTISTELYTSELLYTSSTYNFMYYSSWSQSKTETLQGIVSSTKVETSSIKELISAHTGNMKEQVSQSFTISKRVENGTVSPYIKATSVKESTTSNIPISSLSSLSLSSSSEVILTTSLLSASEFSGVAATPSSSMYSKNELSSFLSPSFQNVIPTSSFVIISSPIDMFSSETIFQLSSSLLPPLLISSNLSLSQFLLISPTATKIQASDIDNTDVLTKHLTDSTYLFTSLTYVKSSLNTFPSRHSKSYSKMSTVNVHESIQKSLSSSSKLTDSESGALHQTPLHQTQFVAKVNSTSLSPSSDILPIYSEQSVLSLTSGKIQPTKSLGIISVITVTGSTVIKPSRATVDSSSKMETSSYFSSDVSPSTATGDRNTVTPKPRGKSSELRENEITSIAIGVGVGGGIFIIFIAFVVVIAVLRKKKKRGRKDFFQRRLPPELFMSRSL